MISGGKGGAKTNESGLAFEKRVNLRKWLKTQKGYFVKDNEVYFQNQLLAKFYGKHDLYRFLKSININWKTKISKKLLPDEALHILKTNTFHIIEMKSQKVSGSVDEKLQTCGFKLMQYSKLFSKTKLRVKYCYILNEWFKDPKYKDTLDYVDLMGCSYFFTLLPWEYLELPKPTKEIINSKIVVVPHNSK